MGHLGIDPAVSEVSRDDQAAYTAARYTVETSGGVLTLRVGSPSEALARLHARHGVASSALVTAYNPLGEDAADHDNRAAHARLLAGLGAAGLRWLPALGDDPSPGATRPGEPSVLVLGVSLAEAMALGQAHRQNAVLWAGPDATPVLVLVR